MNKPEMHTASPAFLVETLTKRSDFLKAAKGKRHHMPGFVIQARKRSDLIIPFKGRKGHDYVLIGRAQETSRRNFSELKTDLERALNILHPK